MILAFLVPQYLYILFFKMENKSGLETVREEVTNLGHMAFEAECLLLLCDYFAVEVSKEIKAEHIQHCKIKLAELRAAIVGFEEKNLNAEEKKEYLM